MSEHESATGAPETAVADEIGSLHWAQDPELLEELHEILARLDGGRDTIKADVRALEIKRGEAVYSELIYLLSHLKFPVGEAKPHWENVMRHRRSMRDRLGEDVDPRVALVSYFVEVNQQLKNPKIIEMRLFERERDSAYRDMLTGLYNYRLFREHLSREIFRADRYSKPLSLVMIDVDHFKRCNDALGHEAGNRVIQEIAKLITGSLRKTDFAARYGGDEFVLILPATPKTSAQLIAERTRRVVGQLDLRELGAEPGTEVTVSMGVATLPADAADAKELIRKADRALYLAKAAGKNQVMLYGQSRRSFGRISIAIPGSFRVLADEVHPFNTVNVSEAGLAFRTELELAVGAIVEFTIDTDADRQVTGTGRVIHVESESDGLYRAAVCIIDAHNADRARLVRLVRESAGEFPIGESPDIDRPV